MVAQGQSVYITGKAGTGKSTLLQHLRATTTKAVAVVAPTGIAAINVGGQTIHSFFHFPPHVIRPQELRPCRDASLMRRLDMLIVDEVSMVRADLMDGIDAALRLNRGRPQTPFGGVQIVLIGDLFQLPPVVREQEVNDYLHHRYKGPYFFGAPAFRAAAFGVKDLQKVYRQKDTVFLDLLNNIREKRLDGNTLELLNSRVTEFACLEERSEYVTLTPTNEAAFRINMEFLERLPMPETDFDAVVVPEFEERDYPTDRTLRLRRGARVMMLKNDPEKRWVNGTVGTVSELGPEQVWVAINGSSHKVERYTWENIEYCFDRRTGRIDQRVVGTFQQYPLRLAWALTIHKSQGQTLDRVCLDLGGGAFAHGQTYVALSRCTSLQGIALSRPIFQTDVIFDDAVYGYRDVFTPMSAEQRNSSDRR
jgi:energy-coupling factor transporter ATP-binding protein EcfA2